MFSAGAQAVPARSITTGSGAWEFLEDRGRVQRAATGDRLRSGARAVPARSDLPEEGRGPVRVLVARHRAATGDRSRSGSDHFPAAQARAFCRSVL